MDFTSGLKENYMALMCADVNPTCVYLNHSIDCGNTSAKNLNGPKPEKKSDKNENGNKVDRQSLFNSKSGNSVVKLIKNYIETKNFIIQN